jgi:hypothetical protein
VALSGDPDDLVEQLQRQGIARLWAEQAARKQAGRGPKEPKPISRGHPERDAQNAVVKWLRSHGLIVSATQNERGAKSQDAGAQARFGQARKASGVTAGFPDLTLCLRDGRTAYIEMKSSVGRLSQAQLGIHAWLEQHGHIVVTGTSIETVQAALAAKGVIIGPARMRMAAPVAPL